MKDSRQHEILFLLWILFASLPPTNMFIMISGGVIALSHMVASMYYSYKEYKEKSVE